MLIENEGTVKRENCHGSVAEMIPRYAGFVII
jgi:hypothetical protein